jgi:hypothetical protein
MVVPPEVFNYIRSSTCSKYKVILSFLEEAYYLPLDY